MVHLNSRSGTGVTRRVGYGEVTENPVHFPCIPVRKYALRNEMKVLPSISSVAHRHDIEQAGNRVVSQVRHWLAAELRIKAGELGHRRQFPAPCFPLQYRSSHEACARPHESTISQMKTTVRRLIFGLLALALSSYANYLLAQTIDVSANAGDFSATTTSVDSEVPDFNVDVRPILATHCFPCHGPDEASRAADLRLDSFAGATADLGGYQAIKPESLTDSELVRRIESADPDERMPPHEFNKPLTARQIQMLRAWIESGANYQKHWAFVGPTKSPLPTIDSKQFPDWSRNPVDHFVLKKMLDENLSPSSAAPPNMLIRRLFLDLIGLPPTIEESEHWQQQLTMSPLGVSGLNLEAYERLVDDLLASPHYGERWARRWLDLARYADTNGYEKDRPRSIWPYRDWVIESFNRDLPFDQFTIEQLAGDLLPDPDQNALIATGFHRNTMLNEEGGIDPLEFRFHAMTDRVATTGTTWLGLTLGCAQCHTHKYDPVTHRNYYQVMAFLNNTEEPDLELPKPEELQSYERRLADANALIEELPTHWPLVDNSNLDIELRRTTAIETAFDLWLERERRQTTRWEILRPAIASSTTLKLNIESDHSIFASGDITKDDLYTLIFSKIPAGTTAIRLEVLPDDRLPARGPGMAYFEGPKGDFFLGEFAASITTADGSSSLKLIRATETDAKNNFGGQNVSAQLALDGDPQTGWSCADQIGERNVAVFNLSEPLTTEGALNLTLRFGRHYPCSLGRFRIATTTQAGEVIAALTPTIIEELLFRPAEELSLEENHQLRQYFFLQAPELNEQANKIRELKKRPSASTTLVFRERPADNPRATFLHHRGEFLQPKELVQPDVPDFLPPLTIQAAAKPRLEFAKWLVAPENPLTARVQVNRAWSALFGQGLVTTEGDFGRQGNPPSHPELLDWLAEDFVEQGQSIKKLHRQLVLSATYRQSSLTTENQLKLDPQNRWLSKANRIRLDAEQVRDLVLTAAGLLNRQQFGPPVFPPQPEGANETAYGGAAWNTSVGPDRFRRGIYTFLKRTTPYAMFNTFDAPSGEFCLAQRETSNTPLQALSMLNDTVILEAAESLGEQLASQPVTDSERIDLIFKQCLNRPASSEEQIRVSQFVQLQRQRIVAGELQLSTLLPNVSLRQAKPNDTESLHVETEKPETYLNEIAAWAVTARVILNLDETIMRN